MLISVGRLAKEKNWETLIEAAAKVMGAVPNVRLVILGDGDEREDLEKLVKKLGVAEQVSLPGLVPFEEVPGYLAAADLFCFASVSETQGLVTMEAMAAGLPVVTVDASGTADVVEDGVDGLLTGSSAEELAAAMIRVLEEDALREWLISAGREKVKIFDIKRQAEQMVGVYEKAIEAHRNGRHIQVDERKPLLKDKWYEILGLDHNPFKS